MPIRPICSPCCARAASGHPAVAPPRSEINSRRRMEPHSRYGRRRGHGPRSKPALVFRSILCLPTAPGCQLSEAETSVRRRFEAALRQAKCSPAHRRYTISEPGPMSALCQTATFALAAKGAPYSITSSARASNVGGTARPSAVAVLRLITNSYLVGACTGRSAGFSPLSIRST
jgi:hypothetical protein